MVLGTALMPVGANSRTVAAAVDSRVAEIVPTLPADVTMKTVLDRTALVDATIYTVATNLIEGALLVVVVLLVLLGSFLRALIAALAIPLSMLLTAIGMEQTRISANLMSLGAIDFGLIVDGAVIVVENCLRLLGERRRELGRSLTTSERLDTVWWRAGRCAPPRRSARPSSCSSTCRSSSYLVFEDTFLVDGATVRFRRPRARPSCSR